MTRNLMDVYCGYFELVFRKLKKTNIAGYFRDIFLFYHENVSCMGSLESSHRGDSNEYTQHTIIL